MKSLLHLCTLFLLSFPVFSQNVPKTFVIEDHTGAWCGWCVLGNQALKDLHAEFGNRVIPIAVHNRDGMSLPMQTDLAKVHNVTGYPSGVINRKERTVDGNTGYGVHPSSWNKVIDTTTMKQTSPVKVQISSWKIDTNSKTISITVSAEFFEDFSESLSFNCAVMEDSVTGTGKQFDQVNYVSNRAGYEGHPYFYEDGTIINYVHENVLRHYGGGIKGIQGSLAQGAFYGDVKQHTFVIPLDTMTIQHPKHVWVAAWVQYAEAGHEILNAASAGKSPTPKSLAVAAGISVTTPPAQIESGTKHNHTIKLNNTREFPITVRVFADQESIISDGWSFAFTPPEIEIPAKSSRNVSLETSSASGIGAANYIIRAQVVPKDSIRGLSTKTQTTVISKEQDIVLMHFNGTPQDATLQNWSDLQASPLYAKKVSIIAINDSNVNAFNFSNVRAFIVPESYRSRTNLIYGSKKVLPFIDAQFKAGKPMLMWSPMNLWLVAGNYPPEVSQSIKNVWNNTFGIDGEVYPWAPMLWNMDEGKPVEFGVKGNSNDMHTSGISFTVNNPANQHTSIWVDCLRILDNEKAKAVLFFDSDKLQDPLHVAAVKIKSDKGVPAIYQGFPMECAGSGSEGTAMRQVLLHNYMDYLLNKTDIQDNALQPLGIVLSPNPVSSSVQITIPVESSSAIWKLYAKDGELKMEGESTQSTFTIDCTGLSSGSYHGVIEHAHRKTFFKFIVQH